MRSSFFPDFAPPKNLFSNYLAEVMDQYSFGEFSKHPPVKVRNVKKASSSVKMETSEPDVVPITEYDTLMEKLEESSRMSRNCSFNDLSLCDSSQDVRIVSCN